MDIESLMTKAMLLLGSKPLPTLEELILRRSLQGKRYSQIAEEGGYDDSYVRRVGRELWVKLSQSLKVEVTKSNVLAALQHYSTMPAWESGILDISTITPEDSPLLSL